MPQDAPEGILDDFFGILLVAGDPQGEAIHAVAVGLEEPLGGGGVAPTQRFDERPVTVHSRGNDLWIGRDVELCVGAGVIRCSHGVPPLCQSIRHKESATIVPHRMSRRWQV